MTKLSKVVGIDISKAFFDVCVLEGEQVRSQRFVNDGRGCEQLLRWLGPAALHCCMEVSGPYYLRLAAGLYQAGHVVSVVNPLVIKRYSQMQLQRSKTDKGDARLIAHYTLQHTPPRWAPPARQLVTLQQLQGLSQQLQQQHTALQNQQQAFAATGMLETDTRLLVDRVIKTGEKQLLQVEQKITALLQQHYHSLLARLTTIPGVGNKTAAVLIMITGGFQKFGTAKQLAAYVGLCPRIYESGSSVRGKSRICKMGMSRIRALLYVCAWSAVRCNGGCKQLYERLKAKGKSAKLALIAVCNKLLKQAFAIATKNTTYDPNYSPKNICL